MRTFDNIRKIAIGQRNDYAIVCLLDYINFKEHYKMKDYNAMKNKLF